MLNKDPEERISIFDFLLHPWFRKYQREAAGGWDTSDSSLSDSIDTLEDEKLEEQRISSKGSKDEDINEQQKLAE